VEFAFDSHIESKHNPALIYAHLRESHPGMLEASRDLVRNRVLENTNRYAGHDEFNRHGIRFGLLKISVGTSTFFVRLLCSTYCAFQSASLKGAMFAPGDSPQSLALPECADKPADAEGTEADDGKLRFF
jgi:hypothetical protein